MATFEIIMPKMGESIEEATITKWFVKVGDKVQEDDILLEIATDKVDSEIPSPVEGVLKKIFFKQDEVVAVGAVIALIDLDGNSVQEETQIPKEEPAPSAGMNASTTIPAIVSRGERFYSPLVRKMAVEEGISQEELDAISGSGLSGRVQKDDVIRYLESRGAGKPEKLSSKSIIPTPSSAAAASTSPAPQMEASGSTFSDQQDEVIEMSRLRKLIAEHMVKSKQVSAHVTNMIEVDVTNVVNWRSRVKDDFQRKEGVKLTYLPVFLAATLKALRDFPQINSSVVGDKIIVKKRINLGVAVSLPGNNLIVPNIKDADSLNLTGITKRMNELASAARSNKLSPDDISGGTFTVTNFGSFQNDIGTPIINQPEVAILAVGAIKKKPAVLETEFGDVIAIRQKMWLSLTYDHRIIDGALGGAFLKKLGDYIESFDPESGNFK